MAGDIGYTGRSTFVDGSTTVPVSAANLNAMDDGIVAAHLWIDRQDERMRHLESFTGANHSAQFRQALTDVAAMSPKPIILIPPGATLDSGANNPFILPNGVHIMGIPGSEDEFGYGCPVYLRHTGSTTTLGTLQWASASKGQKISGISFQGTASTRAFVDVDLAGGDGRFPQYVAFNSVSFNQFESVMQTTGTGIKIMGAMYCNNFACTRPPFYLAGSDHTMFSNGCLMEMGLVATYATRAALPAMVRGGSLSNTSIGPVYWTGSPSTVFRIDGGTGGVNITDAVFEGRPSHGSGTLHAAGALTRLTAGRGVLRLREHGYAMRRPADSYFTPGGFHHIEGGDWVIDGGTFTPYATSEYISYTRPDGTTHPTTTTPPLVWVSGTARVRVVNITRGANAASAPEVWVSTANTANVTVDSSCTKVTY